MDDTLKQYAIAHLGVAADADDEEIKAAIAKHVTQEEQPDPDLKAASELIGQSVREAMADTNVQLSKLADRIDKLETQPAPKDETPTEPTEADKLIAASASAAPNVRLKDPIEAAGYKTAREFARYPAHYIKSGRPHPQAGELVTYGKGENARFMRQNSEADYAKIGAWLKWNLTGGGRLADNAFLNDHEKQLVNHCLDKDEWCCGTSTSLVREWDGSRRLDANTKASLLGDTTSGGSYAVPRAFDDELFMNPILYGELVPWVSILDIAQGVVVDGAYLANDLSITSNTAEGSAITLFDATGLIGNLDTNIFVCSIGIEIGLDWLQDQAMDVGRLLPMRMGERLQEWLDNQIANGDGTTEPEGIFTKSGTGSSSSGSGTSGPITVGDIEELLFGLTKARRKRAGANARFVTNDTMYMRACSVPVGSSDARRVLKPMMDHENYTLMNRGVSIEEHVANGTIGFCALDEYRLVRRLGSQLRETQEGSTLIKANDKIIVLRARFGGQLTLAGALHKITDLDQSIAQ